MEDDVQITTVEELEYYLERWLKAYEQGNPLVSDDCYDHWKRQLELHKPDSPFLQKIGNRPKRNKQLLPYILGSLKNKTIDNIDQWLDKFNENSKFVLSHKMDGVAILCEYIDGKFTNAWLRGDHVVGENITHKAKRFVKLTLNKNVTCEKVYLKGEILLKYDPAKLGYKNKRNAVAGILNRDDNLNLDKLCVIFHTWANSDLSKESHRLDFLKIILGEENVVRYSITDKNNIIKEAEKLIEEVTDYDKDGIVITVDESEVENVKVPEYKIAFKFNKQIAETEVEYVEWNTSRTGRIVPLIRIKPIDIGGITISKCSGFNARFILENSIGKGAKIKVVRSGDVIPYVEQVITKSSNIDLIESCPTCSQTVSWDENSVNLICKNSLCLAQIQKRIAHFFEQIGLEGFSEKMIMSLNCNSIKEIYNLTPDQIISKEGWGKKSAYDFLRKINDLKNCSSEKILAALGIDGLGTEIAKLLLRNFTFKELIENTHPTINEDFVRKLINIKGIGPKKIKNIVLGLYYSTDLIKDLIDVGFRLESSNISSGKLKGKSFCITGTLSKPRKVIEKLIEDNGGVNTSINNCDYLICNNPSDSNKYQKAIQRKIPIITENDLYQMLL